MTYGLSTRAFVEDGPVEQVAKALVNRLLSRGFLEFGELLKDTD